MLTFYPEGSLVLPTDDELRTLHKLAFLNGGGSGSGSGGGGSGSGAQEIYWDRDPAAPDVAAKPAISLDTATGVATYWDGAAWV